MRVWRLTSQTRNRKPYWTLQTGARGPERVSLSLGFLTAEEAERAVENINAEEAATYGTKRYGRLLRLWQEGDAGKVGARRFLLGDAGVDEVLAEVASPDEMPLTEYLTRVWEPERSASRPASWRTEKQDWKQINAVIGDLRIKDVDARVMDRMLTAQRTKDGGLPSAAHLRHLRVTLAAAVKYAYRIGHRQDPVPEWFPIETRRGPDARKPASKVVLTLDEVHTLMARLTGQPRAMVGLGVGCGLRPSEITRVQWEDVDLTAQTLMVRGTKTDLSEATVPLLPIALDAMRTWHEECGKPTSGPCWRKAKGGKKGIDTYVERAGEVPWEKSVMSAIKAAGITKALTPYSLRHTAATLLVAEGVPYQSIAKLLRHSNPRMVESVYDHVRATAAPGLKDLAPKMQVAAPAPTTIESDVEVTEDHWLRLMGG